MFKVRILMHDASTAELDVITVIPPGEKFPFWTLNQPVTDGEDRTTFVNMYSTLSVTFVEEVKDGSVRESEMPDMRSVNRSADEGRDPGPLSGV